MNPRVIKSLVEATRALEDSPLGFETAQDEVAFDEVVSSLLRALAVQAGAREMVGEGSAYRSTVESLVDASVAFGVRTIVNVEIECNCYHDDLHDFAGCRGQDESGEECQCRHTTGVVENDDRESLESDVEAAINAKLGQAVPANHQ